MSCWRDSWGSEGACPGQSSTEADPKARLFDPLILPSFFQIVPLSQALQRGCHHISNTWWPTFPSPTSPVANGDFLFIAQKQKSRSKSGEIVGWGDGRKGVRALSPLSISSVVFWPSKAQGLRPGARAFMAKGTADLSGAVLVGYPGLEGSRSWREAEFCQGPKASKGVGG